MENDNRVIKRIGVLTSGGDAPGMNAAVRGVVRACRSQGIEVYGIHRGYRGLLDGDMEIMNSKSVSDIVYRGGTILQTARCHTFRSEEGQIRAKRMCEVFQLDAVVVIGGDGSFRGAECLAKLGVNVMCIPATIDNDVGCTDYTIGFDTAMNTVVQAIDKIKDTASSHERCSLIEVMGRNAGYIALNCAIAGGTDVCLIPEKTFDLNTDVIQKIIACRNKGKFHYVVIIAEGIGGTMQMAKDIQDITGIETTGTILGHLQRGGSPTVKDRVTASLMGVQAADCLMNGMKNQVIVFKGGRVTHMDIDSALAMKKELSAELMTANELLTF